MKSLSKIANHCGTDKGTSHHGYTKIYANYLESYRDKKLKLFEIGIDKGYSIKMWLEYLDKVQILAADISDKALTAGGNIIPYKGQALAVHKLDQSDRTRLETFKEEHMSGTYDVIVDDGSHRPEDIQLTLGIMANKVKKGGYYIIEDLHTKRTLPEGLEKAIDVLTRFQRTGEVESPVMTDKERTYLQDKFKVLEIARGRGKSGGITAILQKS